MSWKAVIVAGLDAAVVAVDGGVPADRRILERNRLLLASEQFDIVAQRSLVALQREDVVGLLVDDFLCDFALAAHGVDGHHRALDSQKVEQRRNGDDLVGLFADLDLPEHHALAGGEGRNDMDGSSAADEEARASPAKMIPRLGEVVALSVR